MPRSVEEWRGANADTPIPARVRLRIFDQHHGRCVHCDRIIVGRLRPRYDHTTAIINGGENRESNLQLLCSECHDQKTRQDVRTKSVTYNKRIRYLGIKAKGRPMLGSKASGWKKTFNHGWVKR